MRKNIPGIHDEPAEEVGPSDVVHGILFGGYGPSDYLCIQVICQDVQQAKKKTRISMYVLVHSAEIINFKIF